jgi:hypothetical protein
MVRTGSADSRTHGRLNPRWASRLLIPPRRSSRKPRRWQTGAAVQMNLFADEGWIERTRPAEKPGFRWRRMRVAGQHLGASLYELALARGRSRITTSWVTTSCSSLSQGVLRFAIHGASVISSPATVCSSRAGLLVLTRSSTAQTSRRVCSWCRTLRCPEALFSPTAARS